MKNRQHKKQKPPCGAVCKKPFCGAGTPCKKAFQRQQKNKKLSISVYHVDGKKSSFEDRESPGFRACMGY